MRSASIRRPRRVCGESERIWRSASGGSCGAHDDSTTSRRGTLPTRLPGSPWQPVPEVVIGPTRSCEWLQRRYVPDPAAPSVRKGDEKPRRGNHLGASQHDPGYWRSALDLGRALGFHRLDGRSSPADGNRPEHGGVQQPQEAADGPASWASRTGTSVPAGRRRSAHRSPLATRAPPPSGSLPLSRVLRAGPSAQCRASASDWARSGRSRWRRR